MKARASFVSLLILFIVGSIIVYYSMNMVFADVANVGAGFDKTTILVTFPGLMLSFVFVLAILFVIKANIRPKSIKRMSKTYLIILFSFSLVALVTAILGGIIHYGSILAPYPFAGYLLISIIVSSLLMIVAPLQYFLVLPKLKDDEEPFKVTIKHVVYNTGIIFYLLIAMFSFGGFLYSFNCMEWRILYKTFPFYLSLAVPIVYFAYLLIKKLGMFKESKVPLVLAIVYLALTVVLQGTTMILGFLDTEVISAISPLMPLERLAAMPITIILHTVIFLATGIFAFIKEIKANKK